LFLQCLSGCALKAMAILSRAVSPQVETWRSQAKAEANCALG
jgi:hypothetical protein